ncbi:hypothetical protein AX15_002166 [Amanita polypyramis BW_CC]|nr:hypothetical protein AX15_002166 [Amanita polypyramis BW_CC]
MALNRPRTSKPRGICKYYKTARGCFANDTCKFLHNDPSSTSTSQPESPNGCVSPQVVLTPYDSTKTCRYFSNGYCKRGADCWFRHVIKNTYPSASEAEEEELLCSICLEKPVTFGLLGGCNHVFCVQCIRQWRDPETKSGDLATSSNTKKCPMCRSPSRFITPSSRFWKEGEEGKAKVVLAYKESMSRVPCRYFQETKKKKPFCPFGKDCFYQHINDDGTKYVFRDGVDVCMKIHSSRRTQGPHTFYDINYEPRFLGTMDFDIPAQESIEGIPFLTLEIDGDFHDVAFSSGSREDQGRPRVRRRELLNGSGSFDTDVAAAFRELERSLDIIINEGLSADANAELSLLRESLAENIYLLFRQHAGNHGDSSNPDLVRASPSSASHEENGRSRRFLEHMRMMVWQS